VKTLLVIAVLTLIGSPMGGLHQHLSDSDGFAGLHTVHLHDEVQQADESDSSIAELLGSLIHLYVIAGGIALAFLLFFRRETLLPESRYTEPFTRKHCLSELRLRAPPQIR